jgi:hypothetical protein
MDITANLLMGRLSGQFSNMSSFDKKGFRNIRQRIKYSYKNVRGAGSHYLIGVKRRRGDGGNTAHNASLLGLKRETGSGLKNR